MKFTLLFSIVFISAVATLLGAYLYIERARKPDELVGSAFWLHFFRDLAIMPVAALVATGIYLGAQRPPVRRPMFFRSVVLLFALVAGLNVVVGCLGNPPRHLIRIFDVYRYAFRNGQFFNQMTITTFTGHLLAGVFSSAVAIAVYSRIVAARTQDD